MTQLYRAFAQTPFKRILFPYDASYAEKTQDTIAKNPKDDFYQSIYLYDQRHFDQFQQTGKLAGITDVKTDRLVFDLDSKADVSLAQHEAIILSARLQEYGVPLEAIRTSFSGGKGFHIEVMLEQGTLITRKEFENIVFSVGAGLQTLDDKVKDQQRLLRFPLTLNKNTNRYKIPLTLEQLNTLSLEQIKELSLMETGDDQFAETMSTWKRSQLPPKLKDLAMKAVQKEKELVSTEKVNDGEDKPDLSRKPKHLTAAKFVLQEGFFGDGDRNEACMILASTYRHLGYNKDLAYNMLKSTLRLRANRLGRDGYDKEELWDTIITPVYGPQWKGGTFSEEEGLLARTIAKYNLSATDHHERALVNLTSLTSHYKKFAENIDNNTVTTGLTLLDKNVRMTTEMLVCILAAPSAGKTSFALGVLNHNSLKGDRPLFFSLDMASNLIIQRLIQRHTGYHADRVLDIYKKGEEKEIKKFEEILDKEYKNVKFCFKSGITTSHIRDAILAEKERNGIVPKMVLIDYLECIKSEKSNDPTISKGFIASELKDIANELGCCVVLLVQPAKISGGPAEELLSYTNIKGSSVIGEAASVVLTLHRPGFGPKNPEDDIYATVNVVKNRMGQLGSYDFTFDGLRGILGNMSSEDVAHLKALREEIAKEKAEERNKSNKMEF